MKFLVILVVFVAGASCMFSVIDNSLNADWESFKKQHNKTYIGSEEEFSRFEIPNKKSLIKNYLVKIFIRRIKWENNLKIIANHNKKADAGEHTFWLGMNAYGDMVNIIFS